jgi:ABC-2 type transport system permease protein
LGLVDQTGLFAQVDVSTLGLRRTVPVEVFADEAAAQTALESGSIDAFFVVPSNYLETGDVRAVSHKRIGDRAENVIEALLQQGLLAKAPQANRDRLINPAQLALRTLDGEREVSADNLLLFFMPYAFALLFLMTTFTTSGYLLQAVSEEKEDRVMELLATTLAPHQMMAGKIIGLCGVGLTQMLVWIGLVLGTIFTFGREVSWFAEVQLPWSLLGLSLLFFLLGYLLIASCYATIGAAVTTPQEAQPFAAPISLLALSPMMLIVAILAEPNGTLAVVLSLIPFSAPITMLMRLPLADIPPWQIIASLFILTLTTTGAVLLSARVMRLGMLRYGKRLSLADIMARTRSAA